MTTKTSIKDIDLNSIPGKRYMSFTREWREEFIYFLLVDLFHDDRSRTSVKQLVIYDVYLFGAVAGFGAT